MQKFDDITEPESSEPTQLEFAPGCFDEFEGTQEELDEFIAEIQRLFKAGRFTEKSQPVTEKLFEELSPEMQQKLLDLVNEADQPKRTLN
jgi:hypothetical protein